MASDSDFCSDVRIEIQTGDKVPLDDVYNFILNNNILFSGNCVYLSEANLKNLSQLDCIFSLGYRGDYLVATMISYVHTTTKGISCYTSYLCIVKEYRKKGLARKLIDTSVNYFIETRQISPLMYYMAPEPHSLSSTKIYGWYRPINLTMAKIHNFVPPDMVNKDMRYLKMIYGIRPDSSYKCFKIRHNEDLEKTWQLLKNWNQEGEAISYDPSLEEWQKNCQHFDTFVITKGTQNIAIFILFINLMRTPAGAHIKVAHLSYLIHSKNLSRLDIKNVAHTIASVANKNKAVILHGYFFGQETEEFVFDFHGIKTAKERYLELHKSESRLKPSTFYPIVF